ncbi:Uncharacterized protein FWK35_00000885, partial [Aphis craccivora]
MSGTVMYAHYKWCRSVIDNLDLEVDHIIRVFGLPQPTDVFWIYRNSRKLNSSSKMLSIQQECLETYETYEDVEDGLRKPRGFWRRTKKRLS